jgi:hypothetical protein
MALRIVVLVVLVVVASYCLGAVRKGGSRRVGKGRARLPQSHEQPYLWTSPAVLRSSPANPSCCACVARHPALEIWLHAAMKDHRALCRADAASGGSLR